ncbi:MAG: T9SS type A sorting domain-containing protein, partial [Flavobacteriales bacterium]|nr:T9SS type A sorting domain-containing protein [Flavobacteriales bacterium]
HLEYASDANSILTVVDALGRVVTRKELPNNSELTTIDLSNFENGIYSIFIRSNEEVYTTRVCLSH